MCVQWCHTARCACSVLPGTPGFGARCGSSKSWSSKGCPSGACCCVWRVYQRASWLYHTVWSIHHCVTTLRGVLLLKAACGCHFHPAFPRQQAAAGQWLGAYHVASLRMAAGNCRLRSTRSSVQFLRPAAVCWAPGPVCHHVWPFIHRFVFLWGVAVEVVVCAMGSTERP